MIKIEKFLKPIRNCFLREKGVAQFLAIVFLMATPVVNASDVEKWSDGTCWVSKTQLNSDDESAPLFSLASFNDQVAVQFTQFQLENVLQDKNKIKNKSHKSLASSQILNFHCGAYGHSVILGLKSQDEEGPGYCAWMYFKDGEWQVRSFGGLGPNEESSKRCHGFKRGNLVLYVKAGQDALVVRDHIQKEFDREIQSIQKIGQSALKVVLKEEFIDAEKSVQERMSKHTLVGPLVDVEFNWFSHSVGEFKE